jgi:hypothetical protein
MLILARFGSFCSSFPVFSFTPLNVYLFLCLVFSVPIAVSTKYLEKKKLKSCLLNPAGWPTGV